MVIRENQEGWRRRGGEGGSELWVMCRGGGERGGRRARRYDR